MIHWVQSFAFRLALVCVFFCCLNACGPAMPVAEKKIAKKEHFSITTGIVPVSESLNLQFISEMKAANTRSFVDVRRRLNRSLMSGILLLDERVENFRLQYSNDRIIVRNILFGNGARNYYLSWPEEINGRAILTTSVVHQTLDGNNLWTPENHLGLAFHDWSHHRWIFPIALMFSGRTQFLGHHTLESETQLIKLEMSLDSNENINFKILFRISDNAL